MKSKGNDSVKIPVCVAAYLSIAAGLPARAGEKMNRSLRFIRADLKAIPAVQALAPQVFEPLTVVSLNGNYQATSAADGKIRYSRTCDGKVEKIF